MSDTLDDPRRRALDTNSPVTNSVIAPIVQQITQGNPGAAVAAVSAARKTDQDVTSDFISGIQKSASQIEAAFKAGQASVPVTGTSGSINTSAGNVGQVMSTILGISADAKARIAGKDALAEAQITQATRSHIVDAGMDPNGPQLQKALTTMRDLTGSAVDKVQQVTDMRKQGFFDNPLAFLYNNIIQIPMTATSAARDISQAKLINAGINAQADAITKASGIDAAYFSSKDSERAALVATATLADTKAAALKPLTEAMQQQLGALNLANAQASTGIAAGHLALAQKASAREEELFPLRKEAAELKNQADKLSIAAAPAKIAADQKNLELRNKELQIKIDNAPNEAIKEKLLLERAQLENEAKKFEASQQPMKQQLLEMQVGYYGEVKEGQILQNRETLARLEQQRRILERTEEGKTVTLGLANLALKAHGMKGDLTTLDGMDKNRAEALVQIGQNISQTGNPGIAHDPYATLRLYDKAGIGFGENVTPGWRLGHQATEDALSQAQQQLDAQVKFGQPKLTGKDRDIALQTAVQKNFVDQQSAGWGPEKGVFSTPSVDVLTKNEALKDNPIVEHLKPLAVDGAGNAVSRGVDGNMLMNAAAELVSTKKLTESQAVEAIHNIARTIQSDANTTFGYGANGIPLMNKFIMPYSVPSMVGSNVQRVDLFNRGDTLTKLRRQVGSLTAKESVGMYYGSNPIAPSNSNLESSLADRNNQSTVTTPFRQRRAAQEAAKSGVP